jgi:hypothetical protein
METSFENLFTLVENFGNNQNLNRELLGKLL